VGAGRNRQAGRSQLPGGSKARRLQSRRARAGSARASSRVKSRRAEHTREGSRSQESSKSGITQTATQWAPSHAVSARLVQRHGGALTTCDAKAMAPCYTMRARRGRKACAWRLACSCVTLCTPAFLGYAAAPCPSPRQHTPSTTAGPRPLSIAMFRRSIPSPSRPAPPRRTLRHVPLRLSGFCCGPAQVGRRAPWQSTSVNGRSVGQHRATVPSSVPRPASVWPPSIDSIAHIAPASRPPSHGTERRLPLRYACQTHPRRLAPSGSVLLRMLHASHGIHAHTMAEN
jgi:hypothetical protein